MISKLSCVIILAALAVVPGNVSAQTEYEQESVFFDYLNIQRNDGFLNLPGLHFHSSVGFSFFSSNAFGSFGTGYYIGHFDYRLSSSLTLRWDIGIHSTLTGQNTNEVPEFFIPNLDLTYRPNDSLMLRIQYSQVRTPYPFYYGRRLMW